MDSHSGGEKINVQTSSWFHLRARFLLEGLISGSAGSLSMGSSGIRWTSFMGCSGSSGTSSSKSSINISYGITSGSP